MNALFAFVALFSIVVAQSEVTITSFSPVNGTYVDSVETPVSFLFSDEVVKGTGCVVLKNTFGDIENICANSTNFVLDGRNLTVSSAEKLYYGSSYSVYFIDGPVVDKDGNAITLAEGVYMFNVNKKDNGPMFLGIGIGMCLMLIFIFVLYFILKCLVKRKEARENALPQTVQEAK